MKKNYVLDTNILLQDAEAPLKFEDNDIYLPMTVIDELDHLKNSPDSETAYSARCANRALKEWMLTGFNMLEQKVALKNGGSLYIQTEYDVQSLPKGLDPNKNDHIILLTAKQIQRSSKRQTILVTKDVSMRLKAALMGIPAEDYKNQQIHDIYTGRKKLETSGDFIDQLYETGTMKLEESEIDPSEFHDLKTNGFLTFIDRCNPKHSALAVFHEPNELTLLKQAQKDMAGVQPKNAGQYFAKEALLTPISDAPLTILNGPAGTGKTFLALAAGLQMFHQNQVRQILIYRPQSFFDSEIGFLPGDEQSKIDPLLRPIYDNLAYILEKSGETKENVRLKIQRYFENGIIRAEAFTYLRGRSITNSFIILDEAQNTTRLQMKGAITRVGTGSKIVICGDQTQVDNPRLDSFNNGLIYAMNKMKSSPLCWQVSLTEEECRRSALAMETSQLMAD